VEYDGTGYVGWQHQENGPSIQVAIEAAVAAFAGETVRIAAAGRTDAGVHAFGQVAHLDLTRQWPAGTVRDALNAHLRPAPIVVLDAAEVSDDFHARFSATGRRYLYRILNRATPPALDRERVWWVPQALDASAMARAAQKLVGPHDFTSFRSVQCQARSPVKTLSRLELARVGDEIRITAQARSFLHNQVRAMAGTLKLVGEGKWTPADVAAALAARDRAAGGPTAPACGLFLLGADYENTSPE
jgi:tRNA pseudouridine38-40 synthase